MTKLGQHIRVSEAAKYLGVSSKTLRRWNASGKLVPERSAGGHRFYTFEQLRSFSTSNDSPRVSFDSRGVAVLLVGILIFGLAIKYTSGEPRLTPEESFVGSTSENQDTSGTRDTSEVGSDSSKALGLSANTYTFTVNVPARFNSTVDFGDNVVLPNVIYSLDEGSGISITSGQNPTISNTGVLSLGGSTGALSLSAGSGISISGLTITNSSLGSSQNIFKTLSISGQSDIVTDSNTDTLTFAEGTGITLTTDATNEKVTFTADTSALNVSGWTDSGTSVYTTTLTDSVGIGTASPSYSLHLVGTESVSGLTTLASTLGVTGATTLTGALA